MEKVLKSLKDQAIISKQEILSLQQDLKNKYPDYTNMQRAQLFATAVQHRLDTALSPFGDELSKKIKFTLLRQTIHKQDFCINAYDIIESYQQLDDRHLESLDTLTDWINQYEEVTLTCEDVSSLLSLPASIDSSSSIKLPDDITLPPLDELSSASSKTPKDILMESLHILMRYSKAQLAFFILTFSIFSCVLCYTIYQNLAAPHYPEAFAQIQNADISCPISLDLAICTNYLQEDLQYTEINTQKLNKWLQERRSMLAKEPYFSTILAAAKEFNVNPLLLFAITGQEQGFVPEDHDSAADIANNPFNIYGSWENYNTDIKQSARIAAQTLIHLGEGCPPGFDQIKWINNSYASDPDWHTGVTYFFNLLKETVQTDQSST